MSNITEAIQIAKDIEFEYNIKLILLIGSIVYALIGYFTWKDKEPQFLYEYYIKHIIVNICRTYLFAVPLWTFLLVRTVSYDVLLRVMVVFYSIAVIVSVFSVFVFYGEKIKMFFTGEGFWRGKSRR